MRRFALSAAAQFPIARRHAAAMPSSDFSSSDSSSDSSSAASAAASARREIHELWASLASPSPAAAAVDRPARVAAIAAKYRLDPAAPRAEDVSRGLGDALDRLLLLCVPLGAGGAETLERLLHVAARSGRELSVRTVQHLFARTDSFAEALAVFYAMRRCHVAMNMEAYYAMLYSLQRLEEEGWAQRFRDEREAEGRVSEQALDFVLRGINNALLPENKPWLGRVMFEDTDTPAQRRSTQDYDELSRAWTQRYRDGMHFPQPQ